MLLSFVLLLAGSRLATGEPSSHLFAAADPIEVETDKAGIAAILSGVALLVTAIGTQTQGVLTKLAELHEAKAERCSRTRDHPDPPILRREPDD